MFLSRFTLSLIAIFAIFVGNNLPAQTTSSSGAQPTGQGSQGSSQGTSNTLVPHRDPQAVAIVEKAISALGGAAAIGQVRSWGVTAQVQSLANATVGSSALATGSASSGTGNIEWKAAGDEVRAEYTTSAGDRVVVTGHGKPAVIAAGQTRTLQPRSIHQLIVPILAGSMLVNEMHDTNYDLRYRGTRSINGNAVYVVQTHSADTGTGPNTHTWYFDQTSGLPARLEYEIAGESAYPIIHLGIFEFSQYSSSGGVLYPSSVISRRQLGPSSMITVQSVEMNVPVQSSDFDSVSGGGQ